MQIKNDLLNRHKWGKRFIGVDRIRGLLWWTAAVFEIIKSEKRIVWGFIHFFVEGMGSHTKEKKEKSNIEK